jgi:hypothetical protein
VDAQTPSRSSRRTPIAVAQTCDEEFQLKRTLLFYAATPERPASDEALVVGEPDRTCRIRPPQHVHLAALDQLVTRPERCKVKRVCLFADWDGPWIGSGFGDAEMLRPATSGQCRRLPSRPG